MDKSKLTKEYELFFKEWLSEEAYVKAHTSGSTGKPKNIQLLKSDMICSAHATNEFFSITENACLFSPLSSNYIAGKMMLVRACEAGCTLLTETPSNTPLKELPQEVKTIDLMCVVPSQVDSLLNNPLAKKTIRNLIVGGAPLSHELEQELEKMPWNTYVTYGMTETCSHVALRKAGSKTYKALPGITFALDNRNCLIITAPSYSFGTLTTNDVAKLYDSTSFQWIGRFDNVINSGGIKFHPEELEFLLSKEIHTPFYIYKVSHAKWGDTVGITIEDPTNTISVNSILGICQRVLPKYAIPSIVNKVSKLPRTSNGKILRYNN